MPSLEQFIKSRAASDYGMALLLFQVLICCVVLVWLWRMPRFKSAVTSIVKPYGDVVEILCKVVHLRLPVILTIGLVARLPLLNQPLWYDESFTLTVSRLTLEQLPAAIAGDVHPPLYYMLKWAWAHLTGSTAWLFRLPDLAFGLLAIYLMYRLARHVAGEKVGMTAALLTALTPAAIYYSVEARAYALLIVLVFGGLIAFLEERYTLFALLVALLPATHNLGWFYALVFGLLALWRWKPSAYLASFVFYLPLALPNLALAATQSRRMTDGYWLQFNPAQPLWQFTFNLQTIDNHAVMTLVVPYVALTFLSLWTARPLLKSSGRTVALFAAAVPVLLYIVSLAWQPLFLHRAVLPVSLLLLIPLAYALHSSSAHYYRSALVAVGLLALFGFYRDSSIVRPDYRRLLENCGDAHIVYATSIQTAFVAGVNTDRQLIVSPVAVDGGQTLTVQQMPAYGFQIAAPPHSTPVCLLLDESPRTTDTERAEIRALLAASAFDYEYVEQRHTLRRISVFVVSL